MTTVSIIILVLTVLALVVLLIVSKRLEKRIKQLERDLQVNKTLYDSLEEQVSKQYAEMATMNNSLDQYKTLLGSLVKDAEAWKSEQEKKVSKSKKKQEQ